MNRLARAMAVLALALSIGAAGTAVAQTTPKQGPRPSTFAALFDGKSLAGWRAASGDDLGSHWRVDDGAVVADGQGAAIATAKEYRDVELRLEYRAEGAAASALSIRGGKLPDPATGARTPSSGWHALRVVQVGEIASLFVDGTRVADHVRLANAAHAGEPLPVSGPIQLAASGGEVRYRSAQVRELPAAEATRYLRERQAASFTRIFDGTSLDGWQGAVDQYEIVDGAIRCKAGSGGTLFTKGEYSDFTVRFEVKLPPGGNNGLAIRYPGEGDTAYVGMCELQVLDDGDPKYATLDPRQYHGSIYGMVAAHRGYQRAVGEWNFEQVTVHGSHITVELNGTVITDADVATITSFLDNKEHPGKDRTRGFFGFSGHQDPVAFRAVEIRDDAK